MKPELKQRMILLLANSAILMSVYFYAASLGFPIYYIYFALGGILGLVYVIYNKGFSGKNITPEMLPDHMTPEQKQAFIEDSKRRLRSSRWMLTILVPILFTFAADLFYLFVLEGLFS